MERLRDQRPVVERVDLRKVEQHHALRTCRRCLDAPRELIRLAVEELHIQSGIDPGLIVRRAV